MVSRDHSKTIGSIINEKKQSESFFNKTNAYITVLFVIAGTIISSDITFTDNNTENLFYTAIFLYFLASMFLLANFAHPISWLYHIVISMSYPLFFTVYFIIKLHLPIDNQTLFVVPALLSASMFFSFYQLNPSQYIYLGNKIKSFPKYKEILTPSLTVFTFS